MLHVAAILHDNLLHLVTSLRKALVMKSRLQWCYVMLLCYMSVRIFKDRCYTLQLCYAIIFCTLQLRFEQHFTRRSLQQYYVTCLYTHYHEKFFFMLYNVVWCSAFFLCFRE